MDTPTADAIRSRSLLLAQLYPDGTEGDAMIDQAAEVVAPILADLTGRSFAGSPGEEVPSWLVPVAEKAFALKIEGQPSTAKARKAAMGRLTLKSFSAGPYSETYFGPDEAARIQRLDPDPMIHEVLWALATEEKRNYWLWLWGGDVKPEAAVASFNWRARSRRSPRRA